VNDFEISAASVYFPLADANGNAVTYLDGAGNVQAHYTGNLDPKFKFSSKYYVGGCPVREGLP